MLLLSPEASTLASNLVQPALRPKRLDGLRIGFLDNTKAPVDLIEAYLAERIRDQVDGVEVFHIAKQHPSLPADTEVIAALASEADVVINALGD